MEYQRILLENRDGVAILTFNRPEKKNSLDPVMNAEILDAVKRVQADKEARALIIKGVKDSFCTGLDLEANFLDAFNDPDKWNLAMDPILEWYKILYDLPKPTVAQVNGWAFGGGVVPISLCDVAIAASNVKLGLSEINFGHFPAGGTTWAVAAHLLPKHAAYLCLTGDPITAEEAFRMGWISKVVPPEALDEEAFNVAKKMAAKVPNAFKTAKKMFQMTKSMDLASAIEIEMAKIHENHFLSRAEWTKIALQKFKGKELKPGVDSYKREG